MYEYEANAKTRGASFVHLIFFVFWALGSELLVLLLYLVLPVSLELLLDVLEGELPVLDDLPHEFLLLVRPFLALGFALPLLNLLHQEGQVRILLVVAGEYLVVLGQELLVVLLADQVALLLHELHVAHVKFWTGLDLLDDPDEVLASGLQLSG